VLGRRGRRRRPARRQASAGRSAAAARGAHRARPRRRKDGKPFGRRRRRGRARHRGTPGAHARGGAGYEGTLADDRSAASIARVDAFLRGLGTLAERTIEPRRRRCGRLGRPVRHLGGRQRVLRPGRRRADGRRRCARRRSRRAARRLLRDARPRSLRTRVADAVVRWPGRSLPAIEVWGSVLSICSVDREAPVIGNLSASASRIRAQRSTGAG